MANNFSGPVEKIVNNYMKRLKHHLRGLPDKDQEELAKEIHSHIYESYNSEPTENEVERIFNVFDKLGEPAEVVSSRMSEAVVSMGKKRKLPFYILAGILIGFFGLPLGVGGISVLFAMFITVAVLIFSIFVIAFSMIISGWICLVVSIVRLFSPYFLDPYVVMTPLVSDPTLNSFIYILISLIVAGVGFAFFFLGKYVTKGILFLFNSTVEKIRDSRRSRKLRTASY